MLVLCLVPLARALVAYSEDVALVQGSIQFHHKGDEQPETLDAEVADKFRVNDTDLIKMSVLRDMKVVLNAAKEQMAMVHTPEEKRRIKRGIDELMDKTLVKRRQEADRQAQDSAAQEAGDAEDLALLQRGKGDTKGDEMPEESEAAVVERLKVNGTDEVKKSVLRDMKDMLFAARDQMAMVHTPEEKRRIKRGLGELMDKTEVKRRQEVERKAIDFAAQQAADAEDLA